MTSCAGRIDEEYRTCKNEKNKQADFRERRCGNEDGRNSEKNKNISGVILAAAVIFLLFGEKVGSGEVSGS